MLASRVVLLDCAAANPARRENNRWTASMMMDMAEARCRVVICALLSREQSVSKNAPWTVFVESGNGRYDCCYAEETRSCE